MKSALEVKTLEEGEKSRSLFPLLLHGMVSQSLVAGINVTEGAHTAGRRRFVRQLRLAPTSQTYL